jgi:UDP-N-acetylmuramyl pentapeptide synthase
MIRGIFSLYTLRYPQTLIYMLQSTEYQPGPYLSWFWSTTDFSAVAKRRALDLTKAARLLLLGLRLGMGLQIVVGLLLLLLWKFNGLVGGWQIGLALLLSYPLVWAHLVVVPLLLGKWLVVRPRQQALIRRSEAIFRKHPGAKVAIAGSYGKTSMKELLLTVLGDAKKVAATPANKNVAVSHAAFAAGLAGTEDIVLIEYGEGAPGDVAGFARTTHPTHGIITGIAPAHLDHYKSTAAAAADIFSLSQFVDHARLYVNDESPLAQPSIKGQDYRLYSRHGALGWKVRHIELDIAGTSFIIERGHRVLKLRSGLLGAHQVGPLVLAAGLADQFGLDDNQIKAGIAKTMPYEHRMQPRPLAGAWIIDDTYNGNIEGVRAGTALLAALPATRKIYVTPGLVDQGAESQQVHQKMGGLIAAAKPNIVVLMQNSATADIQAGLTAAGYDGEVLLQDDPLQFYTNLDVFVAAGDLVLMQNDWTDNYR